MAVNEAGIVYLHRERFDISTTTHPGVLEFNFVPEIIRDMEVINKDLLANILQLFIQTNKLEPCVLTIVLADNVCFIKDFQLQQEQIAAAKNTKEPQAKKDEEDKGKELHKQIDDFLHHVPFENVANKNLELQNGVRVFASNQDLFESLKDVLENMGFSVGAVIPAGVYGSTIEKLSVLSPQAASFIYEASPDLKKYNMLVQEQHQDETEVQDAKNEAKENEVKEAEITGAPKSKKDSKRIFLLAGVFAVLLVALVVVYFVSNAPTNPSVDANSGQPVSAVEPVAQ